MVRNCFGSKELEKEFWPFKAVIPKVAMWVRLLDLPFD